MTYSQWGHMLMCRQKTSGVRNKIQSTLSRLHRLKSEGSAVGDGEDPEPRVILFEYVSPMDCERVCILTLSSSDLSKESKINYSSYLSVPRKTTKTCGPYAGSRRRSGMSSSSTRSVLMLRLPSGCPVKAACRFINRTYCTARALNRL